MLCISVLSIIVNNCLTQVFIYSWGLNRTLCYVINLGQGYACFQFLHNSGKLVGEGKPWKIGTFLCLVCMEWEGCPNFPNLWWPSRYTSYFFPRKFIRSFCYDMRNCISHILFFFFFFDHNICFAVDSVSLVDCSQNKNELT